MGLDLYNCEICKNPFTQYGGGTIQTCSFCDSWVCYNCIDENSKYRDDELDERCCPICDKVHDKIDNTVEELKDIIDNLFFKKKISSKLHDKMLDLINIISN